MIAQTHHQQAQVWTHTHTTHAHTTHTHTEKCASWEMLFVASDTFLRGNRWEKEEPIWRRLYNLHIVVVVVTSMRRTASVRLLLPADRPQPPPTHTHTLPNTNSRTGTHTYTIPCIKPPSQTAPPPPALSGGVARPDCVTRLATGRSVLSPQFYWCVWALRRLDGIWIIAQIILLKL